MMGRAVFPRIIAIAALSTLLLSGCFTGKMRRELAAEYYNLGNAFFELKKYDRALTLYEKALTYHAAFSEGGYNLARVYLLQERFDEAIGVLFGLLERESDNLIIRQTLAFALAKTGRTEEAVVMYRHILSRSEGNIIALYNLSLLHESREETREAYELLLAAVRISPDDPDILRRLGILEAEHGERTAAIQYLKSYREKKADDVETGFFLVGLFQEEHLYAEALSLVDNLLQRKQEDPVMRFEQAYLLLAKAEEKTPGLEALSKAAELGFDDKERVRTLLMEVPSAFLQEVKTVIVDKGLLTAEEAEETLAAAFGEL